MKRLQILVFLLCMIFSAGAANEYREFTSADGKTIKGLIKAYDARTQTVTIERDNRKTAKVPITIFSEADQAYILEWDAAKGFMSDKLLKISCEKNRVDQRKEKEFEDVTYSNGAVERELMRTTTYEKFVFEFELRNMNDSPLKDLRVEYVVFYEQSLMAWDEAVMEQKTLKGSESITEIGGRGSKTFSSKSVEVHRDALGTNDNWVSGRARKAGEGDVHGIRARFFMKTASGKEFMREVVFPEKLSEEEFPWEE